MPELQEGCYKLKSEHVGARFFFVYARGLGMGSFREIDPTQFARYFLDVPYADEDPRQVMDV